MGLLWRNSCVARPALRNCVGDDMECPAIMKETAMPDASSQQCGQARNVKIAVKI
jgi:hypothetical protein